MTSFGKAQSISQPMRDAERSHRRNLQAVGPDYVQDAIPSQAGFWRQNGAKIAAWALFHLVWWGSVAIFFGLLGVPGDPDTVPVLLVCTGLWFLPSMVLLLLPLVWWRRHVRTRRALLEE